MKYFIYLILMMFISFFTYADITLSDLDNSSVWNKTVDDNVTYYTKKDYGKIPVLCFHKIGEEKRYEITADSFESFLIYLNENKFFVLSDKELLSRDFSKVPTGYTPIVLGSDDASEGNFLYKTTTEDSENGVIDISSGQAELQEDTMVYLLEKYLAPVDGRINFTFYISFDDVPFRQTGGQSSKEEYYQGLDLVATKFNYLLDNFIVGIHTVNHRVTKDISVSDFKWELDEFFKIMRGYTGDRVSMINTLAYPYGCADLDPELRNMILNYDNNGLNVAGAFDFDGYFSQSPFHNSFDNLEVSRFGVDNQNIDLLYGFLESVPLFNTTRVVVVDSEADLKDVLYTDDDQIIVGSL